MTYSSDPLATAGATVLSLGADAAESPKKELGSGLRGSRVGKGNAQVFQSLRDHGGGLGPSARSSPPHNCCAWARKGGFRCNSGRV